MENSTNISFGGGTVTCPRCGRPARVISGTYDFIGGAVRLVRDAGLTVGQLKALRDAAEHARQTGEAPEQFSAANPAAAPIITYLVERRSRDWLVIFLMVISILLQVLAIGQTAEQSEATQQPRQGAETTNTLTDQQVEQIARDVKLGLTTGIKRTARRESEPRKASARTSRAATCQRKRKPHGRPRR